MSSAAVVISALRVNLVRARLTPRRNIEKLFGRQLHDVPNLALYVTVKALSIGTDRSKQTVQTQNTLLLGSLEQSDQGLHCLLFHPHLFGCILAV